MRIRMGRGSLIWDLRFQTEEPDPATPAEAGGEVSGEVLHRLDEGGVAGFEVGGDYPGVLGLGVAGLEAPGGLWAERGAGDDDRLVRGDGGGGGGLVLLLDRGLGPGAD